MKIYDVTKIYGAYEAQPAAGRPVRQARSEKKTDRLMLSKDAVDYQAVIKGLKEVPDVRADKIRECMAKYEAGERFADSGDIAEALLKSGAMKKI
jgi:anti-sigma28 factor (negative regulator of flagellin synthesis)